MSTLSHRATIYLATAVAAVGVFTRAMTAGDAGQTSAPSRLVLRQVWTVRPPAFARHPPELGMGTVSPDGRYFSFMDVATGNLMLHDFQTGSDRQLTTTAKNEPKEYAGDSVFSRDGSRVAYAWFVSDAFEVRVLDLRDTAAQPRVLLSKRVATPLISPHDWSPDDKWIAIEIGRPGRTAQIAMLSVADGTLRVLKSSSEWNRAEMMVFSPDGRYLAYDIGKTGEDNHHDVFVTATDGSDETAPVVHPAHDVVIGWTSDGKDLLFASDRDGPGGVWAVPMREGRVEGQPRLIKGGIALRPRGLTRSGALCFSATTSEQEIYVASVDLGTGKLLSPPTPIPTRTAGFNYGGEWSPDGKSLAYVPSTDNSVVAIQSTASGEVRELRPDLAWVRAERPLWSRDSSFLVVVGQDKKGQFGLYRVDAQTGRTAMLVESEDFARNPVHPMGWSADGRLLYFRRRGEVSTLDTQTRQQRLVDGVTGMFALSPDGRSWAWIDGPRPVHDPRPAGAGVQRGANSVVLQVMPIDGAQPRELLRVNAPDDMRAPTWSPDGGSLLFFKLDTREPNRTVEVWSIPVEGGKPHRIDLGGHVPLIPVNDAELNKPIRIHPDARRIAIETPDSKAEVWMMENVFAQVQASR